MLLCAVFAAGQGMDVVATADHYNRPECQAAITRSIATFRWARICGTPHSNLDPITPSTHCNYQNQGLLLLPAPNKPVLYVTNEKAAHTALWSCLPTLLGGPHVKCTSPTANPARGPRGTTISTSRNLSATQREFVVTFARDPFDMALAGYLEARWLACRHCRAHRHMHPEHTDAADALERLFPNANGPKSCSGRDDATAHFLAYLSALRRGQPLGKAVIAHSLPQVHAKLCHHLCAHYAQLSYSPAPRRHPLPATPAPSRLCEGA